MAIRSRNSDDPALLHFCPGHFSLLYVRNIKNGKYKPCVNGKKGEKKRIFNTDDSLAVGPHRHPLFIGFLTVGEAGSSRSTSRSALLFEERRNLYKYIYRDVEKVGRNFWYIYMYKPRLVGEREKYVSLVQREKNGRSLTYNIHQLPMPQLPSTSLWP